jgi:hypothetical protein
MIFADEDDTTESLAESDYSCFTTGQKCVTSLMYLLDAMECPDYGFQTIMEWARKSFEAGFDFNPKCKTRLGILKWMYHSLHNPKQMVPHLESLELPDPLPNVKTMDVIAMTLCLSCSPFCKTKKRCLLTTWCWTPTTPWQCPSLTISG